MKAGATSSPAVIGWQTLLADLSLILFMVTGAAMSAGAKRPSAAKLPYHQPAAEPLAVWRAGGSQELGHWLAAEQPDGRQHLTITVHYRPGAAAAAWVAAQALVNQAGTVGKTVRIVLAPGADREIMASLAYDQTPAGGTAQGLH